MSIITIAGRFTRNAETRYLPDGRAVAVFGIAETVYANRQQQAQFWECSLFGQRAESLAPHIAKGGAATVFGQPRQRKYTGKDGIERQVIEIWVDDVVLQGAPNRDGAAKPAQQPPQPPRRPQPSQESSQPDEDIPF